VEGIRNRVKALEFDSDIGPFFSGEFALDVRSVRMRMKPARQVVAEKREWHHQLSPAEKAAGFKGWNSRGYLPHFDAPGVQQFISYRLCDAMPAERRSEWEHLLTIEDERDRFRKIEGYLDKGLGSCALRLPAIAEIVQENLWFHDAKSYRLLAWVIMPNHVHVLTEMWKPLRVVLRGWKSYTATRANETLGKIGTSFWQDDYFDRYIRDEDHYRRVVNYIENNAVKAGLVSAPADWPWSSAGYRGIAGHRE
jgi:REP element-mobilizing transposase RayT